MKFCALLLFASQIISLALGASFSGPEEWPKIRQTCYKLLRASPEVRERIESNQFEDDPETHCQVRCAGILAGMYDDETETNLESVAALAKGRDGFEEYKTALAECMTRVTPEVYGDDYCKKGYLWFKCSLGAWGKHIKKRE